MVVLGVVVVFMVVEIPVRATSLVVVSFVVVMVVVEDLQLHLISLLQFSVSHEQLNIFPTVLQFSVPLGTFGPQFRKVFPEKIRLFQNVLTS